MGQQPSRPGLEVPHPSGSSKWWDGLKLALITSAVGVLQLVRYQLALENRREDRERCRRRGRPGEGQHQAFIPRELRDAAIGLIDYQLTPLLVDQWRLKLVSVLLSPETGPVVQEQAGSSDRRRDLLNALAAFQGERRASHARTSRARDPAPSSVPSAPPAAQQPAAPSAAKKGSAASSSSTTLPARDPTAPSAPPMPAAAQASWPAAASAPPLPQEDVQSATCCDICMEADVEVMSTCHPVKHGMCIECARAVCSMKDRAPQCPFCRQAITSFEPVLAAPSA